MAQRASARSGPQAHRPPPPPRAVRLPPPRRTLPPLPQPRRTPRRLLAYPAGRALRCPTGYRHYKDKDCRATAPRAQACGARVPRRAPRTETRCRAPSQTWERPKTCKTMMLGPAGRQACCPTGSSMATLRASAPRAPTGSPRVQTRARRLPPPSRLLRKPPPLPTTPRLLLLHPAGRHACCPTGCSSGPRLQPPRLAHWVPSKAPATQRIATAATAGLLTTTPSPLRWTSTLTPAQVMTTGSAR